MQAGGFSGWDSPRREGGERAPLPWPTPLPTLLMVPGAQEDEEREESGCEEEDGREDEDEDSGSEESLVDSDSDPEEKGAWSWAGDPRQGCLPRGPRETARGSGCPTSRRELRCATHHSRNLLSTCWCPALSWT